MHICNLSNIRAFLRHFPAAFFPQSAPKKTGECSDYSLKIHIQDTVSLKVEKQKKRRKKFQQVGLYYEGNLSNKKNMCNTYVMFVSRKHIYFEAHLGEQCPFHVIFPCYRARNILIVLRDMEAGGLGADMGQFMNL